MNVETMVYAYIAILVFVTLFNLFCIFVFGGRDRVIARKEKKMEARTRAELETLAKGDVSGLSPAFAKFLRKQLSTQTGLMAFEAATDRIFGTGINEGSSARELQDAEQTEGQPSAGDSVPLQAENQPSAGDSVPLQAESFFALLAPEFKSLVMEDRRDALITSYILNLSAKYGFFKGTEDRQITDRLVELSGNSDLYLRENALNAIYSTGDVDAVCDALWILDRDKLYHHEKLIYDGMLAFTGDKEVLRKRLWNLFEHFSDKMQLNLLNYFRFAGGDSRGEVFNILADETRGEELRYSCIRYFGKYSYAPAEHFLLKIAENPEKYTWIYVNVAAMALSNYPSQRATEALKKLLTDSHWHIRRNAAGSLEHFGFDYSDFSEVFEGSDRFAREALQYQYDRRRLPEKKGGEQYERSDL